MTDLPDQASSDTARLIDAIRSLDHTLRRRQPSAPKLIRRKTTLQNGINTGPSTEDAAASGEEIRSGQVIRLHLLKLCTVLSDSQRNSTTYTRIRLNVILQTNCSSNVFRETDLLSKYDKKTSISEQLALFSFSFW